MLMLCGWELWTAAYRNSYIQFSYAPLLFPWIVLAKSWKYFLASVFTILKTIHKLKFLSVFATFAVFSVFTVIEGYDGEWSVSADEDVVLFCMWNGRPLKHRNKMPAMTVMRQSDVSRHEEDDLLPYIPEKSVKHRLQVTPDFLQSFQISALFIGIQMSLTLGIALKREFITLNKCWKIYCYISQFISTYTIWSATEWVRLGAGFIHFQIHLMKWNDNLKVSYCWSIQHRFCWCVSGTAGHGQPGTECYPTDK